MNRKMLRLHRLFHSASGRSILLPLDHGTTVGPTQGLKRISEIASMAAQYRLQGIIAHKGVVQWAVNSGMDARDNNYLLHLSASTVLAPDPTFKQTVTSIRHALQIGVTGISMHINLGVPQESEMLRELGRVSDEAYQWGLPLLVMFNIYDQSGNQSASLRNIVHAVRIAGELGADLVKVPMCEDEDDITELIQAHPIPVLIAGGEQSKDKLQMFYKLHRALSAGGKGICVGRNIFEDENPAAMCRSLNALVHEDASPEQAMALYAESSLREMSFI